MPSLPSHLYLATRDVDAGSDRGSLVDVALIAGRRGSKQWE